MWPAGTASSRSANKERGAAGTPRLLAVIALLAGLSASAQNRDWRDVGRAQIQPRATWQQLAVNGDRRDAVALGLAAEWRLPVPRQWFLDLRAAADRSSEIDLHADVGARFGYRHSHDFASTIDLALGLDAGRVQPAGAGPDLTPLHAMVEATVALPVWFDHEIELGAAVGPLLRSGGPPDRGWRTRGQAGLRRYQRPERWSAWRVEWDHQDYADPELALQHLSLSWVHGWAW